MDIILISTNLLFTGPNLSISFIDIRPFNKIPETINPKSGKYETLFIKNSVLSLFIFFFFFFQN